MQLRLAGTAMSRRSMPGLAFSIVDLAPSHDALRKAGIYMQRRQRHGEDAWAFLEPSSQDWRRRRCWRRAGWW
jgi:hypothetical protein